MIDIVPADNPDQWCQATALLWSYVHWIRDVSGLDPLVEQPSFRSELAALDATYDGPTATLFLAVERRSAIGTVAVRHHPDGSSELKRLFVADSHRGLGIAGRLVDAAVDHARENGSASMWLETVVGFMDPAIALYRGRGFSDAAATETSFRVPGMIVLERPLCPTGCTPNRDHLHHC